MEQATRNFACTQCGKCCNRPPEVELGEAAALADVFVWLLMFRLYSVPRSPAAGESTTRFYETKRLLSRFAAHSYDGKALVAGRKEPRTFHLSISALALDPGAGTCPALEGERCSIYSRRPLSCRSVPLHYSRAETGAEADFDAFVATPGYACATGSDAPSLLQDGRIAAADIIAARTEAAEQADADRRWKAVLVKAVKAGSPEVPSMTQIEHNAAFGASTVPMRSGWILALRAGLMTQADYDQAMASQTALLERMVQAPALAPAALQSIADLRRAYA